MSEPQIKSLEDLGRLLAKGSGRFGEPLQNPEASLIRVERLGDGWARIKVIDAVGLIAIDGIELTVLPKIPQDHFLEIVGRSNGMPRVSALPGNLKKDGNFAILICEWFVRSLEHILAEGLVRDYREMQDQTATVRGRLEPLGTSRLFYSGRVAVLSRFEEFDQDNALNRVLVAAARAIAGAVPLPGQLRRRAVRTLSQMAGIGSMRPSDLAVTVDRSSAHYADGILLAKEVIASSGRSFCGQDSKAWTFLYRTAMPVEEGIKKILAEGCAPLSVRKRSFALGATVRVNPDLVFGDVSAIGDVKYKIGSVDWDRGGLYQVVAFAAAARVDMGVLVDFNTDVVKPLCPATFGEIKVVNARWKAATSVPFEAAREDFVAQVAVALTAD